MAERPPGRSDRSHRAAASGRGAAWHDGSCPCRFAAGRFFIRAGCAEGRAGPRGDDPGDAAGRTHRLRTDPDLEGRSGSGTGRIDEARQRTVPPPGSKRASGRCGDCTTVVCRQSPGNRRQGAGIWQGGARRLHTRVDSQLETRVARAFAALGLDDERNGARRENARADDASPARPTEPSPMDGTASESLVADAVDTHVEEAALPAQDAAPIVSATG